MFRISLFRRNSKQLDNGHITINFGIQMYADRVAYVVGPYNSSQLTPMFLTFVIRANNRYITVFAVYNKLERCDAKCFGLLVLNAQIYDVPPLSSL